MTSQRERQLPLGVTELSLLKAGRIASAFANISVARDGSYAAI